MSLHPPINIGMEVRLKATFRDPETNAIVEPATVKCTVVDGKDAKSEPSVTKTNGVYSAILSTIDSKGYWRYAFTGTGGRKARAEGWFQVNPQLVP